MQPRLIIVGDTHCRFDVLDAIVRKELARAPGVLGVLHCGDIGIYDHRSPGRLSRRELRLIEKHRNRVDLSTAVFRGQSPLRLPLYGIPGNHEDFELAEEVLAGECCPEGFHLLSPGERLALSLGSTSVSVLGMGRILPEGLSDRKRSRPKYVSEGDLAATRSAAREHPTDILLLHEPPMLVQSERRSFGSWRIRELVQDTAPRLVLAGHMHFEYDTMIGDTRVIGVGYGIYGRYAVVHENFDVEFGDLDGREPALCPVGDPAKPKASAEVSERKRKNALKRAPLPFGFKELVELFELGEVDRATRKRIHPLFAALRARLVEEGELSREDALEDAERFLSVLGMIEDRCPSPIRGEQQ